MGRVSGTNMTRKKKTAQNPVGRALVKQRFGGKNYTEKNETGGYQVEVTKDHGEALRDLRSVTEHNDLAEFLTTAEASQRDFTADKEARLILSGVASKGFYVEQKEVPLEERLRIQDTFTIPTRPEWSPGISPEELDVLEKQSFLAWRKELAEIEAAHPGLCVTPYEKNIEVWRQLWRVIERAEIIVQIVDGRNPLLFLSNDLERYVKALPVKREFLVLINKADMLPEESRAAWAAYFKGKNTRYAFWSANAAQIELDKTDGPVDLEEPEDIFEDRRIKEARAKELMRSNVVEKVLSRDELLDLFMELRPHYEDGEEPGSHAPKWGDVTSVSGNRPSAVIGLVGYPNVGKSSTLNVLIGERRAQVSATPGKTKHFQTFRIEREIMVCDCPGLVFPSVATTKAEMICNGILPIDQMRSFREPMDLLAKWIPRSVIEAVYGVILPKPSIDEDPNRCPTGQEVTCAVAKARGYMSFKGNPNESIAARMILKDFVNGKLLYVTFPPGFKGKVMLDQEKEAIIKVAQRNPDLKPTYDPRTEAVGTDVLRGQFGGQDAVVAHTGRRKGKKGAGPKAAFTRNMNQGQLYSPIPVHELKKLKQEMREKEKQRVDQLDSIGAVNFSRSAGPMAGNLPSGSRPGASSAGARAAKPSAQHDDEDEEDEDGKFDDDDGEDEEDDEEEEEEGEEYDGEFLVDSDEEGKYTDKKPQGAKGSYFAQVRDFEKGAAGEEHEDDETVRVAQPKQQSQQGQQQQQQPKKK